MDPVKVNKSPSDDRGEELEFYTIPDAARLLKVSRTTIWRWIESGRLRAYRIGPKNIRVRRSDLEAMVTPARLSGPANKAEGETSIWIGYDPEKVREGIEKVAGAWADLDAEKLISQIYRWREEGSRPEESS